MSKMHFFLIICLKYENFFVPLQSNYKMKE